MGNCSTKTLDKQTNDWVLLIYLLGPVALTSVNFNCGLMQQRRHDNGVTRDTAAGSSAGK